MKGRLFLKIFSSYFLLAVFMGAVLDLLLTPFVREHISSSMEEAMIDTGKAISLMKMSEIEKRIKELAERSHLRITLIDATGKVLADTEALAEEMDNHLYRTEIQEARVKGVGRSVRYSKTLKENFLYIALPLKSEGKLVGYIRLARSMEKLREALEQVNTHIHLIVILTVLPALILSLLFAFHLSSPWKRISLLINQIKKGERPSTLALETGDELERLTGEINEAIKGIYDKYDQLEREGEILKAAFGAMKEGVVVIDGENRIIYTNQAAALMMNKKKDEMVGKTLIEAFQNATLNDLIKQFRETGQVVEGEASYLEEGKETTFEVTISAPPDSDRRGKAVIVLQDISQLKKLEKMRSEFLANVTHELKTPLTAIIGYIESLMSSDLKRNEREKFLNILQKQANRLNRLVDDLILLTHLEQGTIELNTAEVSISGMLEEITPTILPRMEEKGLTFETQIPSPEPVILGDYDRIYQALLNILDNAIKYTDKGKVVLKVEPERSGFITVEISDTGIGIPPIHLPRLGERFYRVDRDRSRKLGGTGLGLSIVRHIMKAHGGKMEITSLPGQGTTVRLSFKAK
ncbi:MAG: ATP-binding protein [Syntrophales bacterium]|nr:ATP-binding protein [Syntrophales bacterium]